MVEVIVEDRNMEEDRKENGIREKNRRWGILN